MDIIYDVVFCVVALLIVAEIMYQMDRFLK